MFKYMNGDDCFHIFDDGYREMYFDALHEKLILRVCDDAPTIVIDIEGLFEEILTECFENKNKGRFEEILTEILENKNK